MNNKNIPIPLYYKLKEEIISMIENEEVKPDELIPSERELIKKFSMSRTTVRKAIDVLVNEGYLYKVQGKGTYVKGKKFTQGLINLTSCTADIKRAGLSPEAKLISSEIRVPSKNRLHILELNDDEKVFFLERVRCGDGYPINRTKEYLPYKLFPGIEKYDFAKESLFNVIEKNYDVKITRANRTIEAILSDKKVSKLLDIPEGNPILLFRGIVYGIINGKEIPIEYFESKYRSDRSKFFIEQLR